MLTVIVALQEARDREASLRRRDRRPRADRVAAHPTTLRRRVGARLVRLGRAVAGQPVSAARPA
jgi:hypothetical protein